LVSVLFLLVSRDVGFGKREVLEHYLRRSFV